MAFILWPSGYELYLDHVLCSKNFGGIKVHSLVTLSDGTVFNVDIITDVKKAT